MVRTEDYIIEPDAWLVHDGPGLDKYLYITCDADFITKSACEDGSVNAYVWMDGRGTWTPLPYVTVYQHTEGMSTTTICENLRFEYAPGEITFIAQDMDGHLPDAMVDRFTFRVTVTK